MMIFGAPALTPVQAQSDLVYVAVNPCRLADTRKSSIMLDGVPRNFQVSGENLSFQGGGSCIHPKAGTGVEPLAASVYIVAVPTVSTGAGWLTAYPSDQIPPTSNSVATLNYAKGQVIGNTTIATLCQPGSCPIDGQLGLVSFSSAQNVVIDVQGYFYPQTAADNTFIVETAYNFGTSYGSCCSEVATATCPTESIMTGGGVQCSSDNFNSSTTNFGVINSSAPAGNSYLGGCYADALSYSTLKFGPAITVFAVCAYSANATSQATSAGVATLQATSADTDGQPQQGEPSEEALLVLESLRNNATALKNSINER
jgi:hypothetical protein